MTVHLTDRRPCANAPPHSEPYLCRDPGSYIDPGSHIDPGSRGGLSPDARWRDSLGSSGLRAQCDLLNGIKLMLPVQSPLAKIFPFPSDPNHLHIPRYPGPHKGAFRDRHERRAGMRWTRVVRLTSAQPCGRRSRVVLTPRRWRQVFAERSAQAKVARKPGHLGEREAAVKTIACGNAGCPGATVVTNARVYYTSTRGCGCNGHPAFPAPPLG